MKLALAIIGYLVVGACAASFRAYIDGVLLLEEGATHRSRTLFYEEAVFFQFFAWPVVLPMLGLTIAMKRIAARGLEDAKRRRDEARALDNERREALKDIDAIIKEHRL